MRIGVDLMGSDSSPSTLFSAVLQELEIADFILFATPSILKTLPSFEHFACSGEITMEDDPLTAVRSKRNSSLVEGIRALSENKIDAFISAGNTGALIAASALILKTFSRPSLLATLPKKNGNLALIDVGGQVQAKGEHLFQYAHMGAAYQKIVSGIECPQVGLLNIGAESKKGTAEVREAHRLLTEEKSPLFNFIGNIEGQHVLQSHIDVLVTDGFTGNVFLKTAEGVSSFLLEQVESAPFHPSTFPGALICGVEGLIIKCHGGATEKGIAASIRQAVLLHQKQIIPKIKEELCRI